MFAVVATVCKYTPFMQIHYFLNANLPLPTQLEVDLLEEFIASSERNSPMISCSIKKIVEMEPVTFDL